MPRPVFALPAAIAIAALFVSCSSAKITFFFRDASYQTQPRKVLVLAVVKKTMLRRLIEDEFVRRFRDRGIEASRGYAVFRGDELPATEVLAKELAAGGFDALLLMRLVDPWKERPGAPPPAADQQGAPADPRFMGWQAYYGHCYTVAYSPNYQLEDKYALVETSLHDTATEKLIWIAASETWLGSETWIGGEKLPNMVLDYADVIMDSLQKSKIVPPGRK